MKWIDSEEGKNYYKEYNKKYGKKYRQKHPEMMKRYHLKASYGMTLEQYKDLFESQSGVCAICNEPETSRYKGKIRNLAVDHCHKTGIVRGLLCNKCNVGIGNLNDNIELLEKAIKYLKNHTG